MSDLERLLAKKQMDWFRDFSRYLRTEFKLPPTGDKEDGVGKFPQWVSDAEA